MMQYILLCFAILFTLCASAFATPKPSAAAVPTSLLRLDLDVAKAQGEFKLLLVSGGPPVALHLDRIYSSKPCLRRHKGALKALQPDTSGVVDTRFDAHGTLILTPKSSGTTTLKARLKLLETKVEPKAPPAAPACDALFGTNPTLDLSIKVDVEVPARVQVTHSRDGERDTVMYALPGATASLDFDVRAASGRYLTRAHNRTSPTEVLLPNLKEDAFSIPAPRAGKERVVKTTVGDTFTFRTVDPATLASLEVRFGRKTLSKLSYGFLEKRTSWRGKRPIQVHVTALATATAPIHFVSLDKIAAIAVHTPKVCVVTRERSEPMEGSTTMDNHPWIGNITPKRAGTCTFTVTVGGASKTRSLQLAM